jgi:HEAT repeat protein
MPKQRHKFLIATLFAAIAAVAGLAAWYWWWVPHLIDREVGKLQRGESVDTSLLERHNDRSVSPLLNLYHNADNSHLRQKIICILIGLDSRESVAAIKAFATDKNSPDRAFAITSLGLNIQDPDSRRLVLEAVDDSHPAVRIAGIRGLVCVEPDFGAAKLIVLVGKEKDPEVLSAALIAITFLRLDEGVLPIISALTQHANQEVRYAALLAVGSIRSREAAEILLKAIDSDDVRSRDAAISALARTTGSKLEFDPTANPAVREEQLKRLRIAVSKVFGLL